MLKIVSVFSLLFSFFYGLNNVKKSEIKEHDNLNDSNLASLVANATNEEEIGLKDKYAPYYFKNLTSNYGNNSFGSCGYVATSMLLSFFDSYLDDNIIDDVYDQKSTLDNNQLTLDTISPGIKREDYSLWEVDNLSQSIFQIIENHKDEYFHLKLISLSNTYPNTSYILDDVGLSFNDYSSLFNNYIHTYKGYTSDEVEVLSYKASDDLVGEERSIAVRDYAINLVKQGIPVKLGIGHNHLTDTGSHAVVAYDYDESEDKLYCHFGLSSNTTHITIEDLGYTSYNNVFAFNFNINHTHNDNYQYNSTSYCSCHYLKPRDIEIVDDNYIDQFTKYETSIIKEDKWIDANELTYKFDFIKSSNNTTLFTAESSDNTYTLTKNQFETIKGLSGNYKVKVYPYSNNSSLNSYYKQVSFPKPSKYKYAHYIRPNNYNYSSTYNTTQLTSDITTNDNYEIEVKSYRAAYLDDKYIVLSSINNTSLSEAYVEYTFTTPILKASLDLSFYSNNENLKLTGSLKDIICITGYDENNTTINTYTNLYNLSTDRNNPSNRTYIFSSPIHKLKIYIKAVLPRQIARPIDPNDTQTGRLCINNIILWDKLPPNGSEAAYEPERWNEPVQSNAKCYSYALNNQLNPDNPAYIVGNSESGLENLFFKDLGAYGDDRMAAPYTKQKIEEGISADLTRFNADYNTSLHISEIGRFDLCQEGCYKIAIIYGSYDFHFYRQNPDGTWSHKPGTSTARDYDANGDTIYDPQFCAWSSYYDTFAGYYEITPINMMWDTLINN